VQATEHSLNNSSSKAKCGVLHRKEVIAPMKHVSSLAECTMHLANSGTGDKRLRINAEIC
jgi:hypothetical protein